MVDRVTMEKKMNNYDKDTSRFILENIEMKRTIRFYMIACTCAYGALTWILVINLSRWFFNV